MHLVLIACGVLDREFQALLARTAHPVDARFLDQGLHARPVALRRALQAEIDRIDAARDAGAAAYDAIVLGIGLCGNGIVGLRSAHHRLVVPRAHDCFTLLLGCRHRYRQCTAARPGTFWASRGWVEHGAMPDEAHLLRRYHDATARFGPEPAAYLLQLERDALARLEHCTFIAWRGAATASGAPDAGACARAARTAAGRGWSFDALPGDATLLTDLLAGGWDERFLTVPPGATITPTYDDGVVAAS